MKDIFSDWRARHFPERQDKVLNRIRAMRDGKLNDPNFSSRMSGQGIFAEQIEKLFEVSARKAGFRDGDMPKLSAASFRRPGGTQLPLF